MMTVADGTTAPAGSVTVPVSVPRSLCADVESGHAARQSDIDSNRTQLLLIVTSLVSSCWDLEESMRLGKNNVKKMQVL
jgi:hypothetical protein